MINYEDEIDLSLCLTNNSINLIKTKIELNFESDFVYETTSLEYSKGFMGMFNNVKLKLEYCRIICTNINEKQMTINNKEVILRPLLCLDFNQITANVVVNKSKNEFKIHVLGSKQEFKFRAQSKMVLETFLIYLNYYISISRGARENLLGVSLRNKFYKVNIICLT